MSPTWTWSKRVTDFGTSSVTTLPWSPRILTVRAAWSTASTVPRTVIWLTTASWVWALAMVVERVRVHDGD